MRWGSTDDAVGGAESKAPADAKTIAQLRPASSTLGYKICWQGTLGATRSDDRPSDRSMTNASALSYRALKCSVSEYSLNVSSGTFILPGAALDSSFNVILDQQGTLDAVVRWGAAANGATERGQTWRTRKNFERRRDDFTIWRRESMVGASVSSYDSRP